MAIEDERPRPPPLEPIDLQEPRLGNVTLPATPIPQAKVVETAVDVEAAVEKAVVDLNRVEAFLRNPSLEGIKFPRIIGPKEKEAALAAIKKADSENKPIAEVLVRGVAFLRAELQAIPKLINAQAATLDAAKKFDTKFKLIVLVLVALLIVLLVVYGKKLDFNPNQYAGAGLLITAFTVAVIGVRHGVHIARQKAIDELEQVKPAHIEDIDKRLDAIDKYFNK